MRIVRTVAQALACTALVPALVLAQATQRAADSFVDSWYWGVKGGAAMFTTGLYGDTKVTAPSVGGEWLITRTHVALNLSVEQSFFDEQAAVYDPTVAGSARAVDVSDWRRYQASMYFVPVSHGNLRPYAGLGLALNVIQNATPTGNFSSVASQDSVFAQVSRFSSRASAVFTGGAMYSLGRAAIFAQAEAMPTRNSFLINGGAYTFLFSGGVRYNVGSAIEKLK